MIYLSEPRVENPHPCAYIPGETACFESFMAVDMSEEELDSYLSAGWRHFGYYFFRPACLNCRQCVPLRLCVNEFKPSRSQRRAQLKNKSTIVRFCPKSYREELYTIYKEHASRRFSQETFRDDFIDSFYSYSCPGLQSEYYVDGNLAAVGFLDQSTGGISSIYFAFRNDWSYLSLGTLSVLEEVHYAQKAGKQYYYLGYYISANKHMNYKNHFLPHELMDWKTGQWEKPLLLD